MLLAESAKITYYRRRDKNKFSQSFVFSNKIRNKICKSRSARISICV